MKCVLFSHHLEKSGIPIFKICRDIFTFYSVNETNASSNGCFFEVQGSMKLRISIKAIDSR